MNNFTIMSADEFRKNQENFPNYREIFLQLRELYQSQQDAKVM